MLAKQFKWLSFICCVGVVIIHSRSYQTNPNPGGAVLWEQYLVAESLVRFSVQTFFVISGFWWARKWNGSIFAGYGSLLAKKWKTLVLPYLIWGALGAVLILGLTVPCNLVSHRPAWDRSVFAIQGLWPFIDALFGIVSVGPLGDMPFWFLRQLIFFFVLTPIIAMILKGRVAWPLSLIMIFGGEYLPTIPGSPVMLSWLGWFVLGAAIGRSKLVEIPFSKFAMALSGAVWIACSVLNTMDMLHVAVCLPPQGKTVLTGLLALSGMIFWWEITFLLSIPSTPSTSLNSIQPHSTLSTFSNLFFIYAFHQFPAQAVISLFNIATHKAKWATFTSFFLAPILTFLVCELFLRFLETHAPKTLSIITGGR